MAVIRRRRSSRVAVLVVLLMLAVAPVASNLPASAAHPGRNGRIAFEWWVDTPDGGIAFELRAINPDGSDLVSLGPGASPAYSADGTRIAFNGPDGIYVAAADGTGATRITTDSGDDVPSWSPDGTTIIFAGNRPDDGTAYHIYAINVDGTGLRRLTAPDPDAFCYYPVVSPDGVRIAFSRDSETIHTLDMITGVEHRVTPEGQLADWPEWSPDGKQLAYIAYTDDGMYTEELHIANADGTSARRVVANSGSDYFDRPAWSPDGTKLALVILHKAPPQSFGLYVVNVDGTGLTRLTNTPASHHSVAWQPLPGKVPS